MADLVTYEQRVNELQDLINALSTDLAKAQGELVTFAIVNTSGGFNISDGSLQAQIQTTPDMQATLSAMIETGLDSALTEAKTRANTFNYSV